MTQRNCFLFSLILFVPFFFSFLPPDSEPTKPVLKTIVIDAGHGGPDPGAQGQYSNEADINLAIALRLGKMLEETLPNCNIVYTRKDAGLPGNLQDAHAANRLRAKIANEARGDLYITIHVNSTNDRYTSKVVGYETKTYYVTVGKGSNKKRVQKTKEVPILQRVRIPETVKGTETYVWAVNKNDIKRQFVATKEVDEFGEKSDTAYSYFDSPDAKIMASLRIRKYFDNSCAMASFVEEEFSKAGRRSMGVKQRNNEGIWVLQATAMPSILVETGFICTPEEEDYLNSEEGQKEVSSNIKDAVLRYKTYFENKGQ